MLGEGKQVLHSQAVAIQNKHLHVETDHHGSLQPQSTSNPLEDAYLEEDMHQAAVCTEHLAGSLHSTLSCSSTQ